MSRQVPHAEDIATGTPTAGLVPVSAGAGLAPAWGVGGGGSGTRGSNVVFEQLGPAVTGTYYVPTSLPVKRLLSVFVDGRSVYLFNTSGARIAEGPIVGLDGLTSGQVIGMLYETERATDRGTVYSDPGSGKCLSLWNVSSNNAPPANWETVGFVDSGWVAPVQAIHWYDSANAGDFVHGARSIWPSAHPAHTHEQVLFRHHFTLTSDQIASFVKAQLRVFSDDFTDALYINGNAVSISPGQTLDGQGPMLGFYFPLSWLIAGDNVLAVWSEDGTDGPPGEAHVSYRIDLE